DGLSGRAIQHHQGTGDGANRAVEFPEGSCDGPGHRERGRARGLGSRPHDDRNRRQRNRRCRARLISKPRGCGANDARCRNDSKARPLPGAERGETMTGTSPAIAMIAAMITPAVLILASASLVASALVRMARVVDRARSLVAVAHEATWAKLGVTADV